jgi:hypothetical protein
VCSVRAEQLPPEVQALAKTPTHFEIEAVFIGAGKAAFLADDPKSVRIEVRESEGGAAETRYAEMLARRFETMEPVGLLESAIVGLVRLAGAGAVAKAALGATKPAAPEPDVTPEVLEMQKKAATRKTRKKVK